MSFKIIEGVLVHTYLNSENASFVPLFASFEPLKVTSNIVICSKVTDLAVYIYIYILECHLSEAGCRKKKIYIFFEPWVFSTPSFIRQQHSHSHSHSQLRPKCISYKLPATLALEFRQRKIDRKIRI